MGLECEVYTEYILLGERSVVIVTTLLGVVVLEIVTLGEDEGVGGGEVEAGLVNSELLEKVLGQ